MTTNLLTTTAKRLPIPGISAPMGSIESYVRFAYAVPMLSAEEEYDLAERLQKQNDLRAAERLVLSHLKFVVKIARGFNGYGLAMADLIQEGNIGLMKAVKRFKPEMGVRLVSFAVHWIKSEMHEFIVKNWRIVKIATTKAQRKLFFNLRSQKKRLGWFSQDEINAVAQELHVKPAEVVEMEQRLNAHEMSFDAPIESEADERSFAPIDYLTTDSNLEADLADHESHNRDSAGLAAGFKALDARSQDIIQKRWLNEPKATLHELADHYGISAERVRQLEVQAMAQLKKAIVAT